MQVQNQTCPNPIHKERKRGALRERHLVRTVLGLIRRQLHSSNNLERLIRAFNRRQGRSIEAVADDLFSPKRQVNLIGESQEVCSGSFRCRLPQTPTAVTGNRNDAKCLQHIHISHIKKAAVATVFPATLSSHIAKLRLIPVMPAVPAYFVFAGAVGIDHENHRLIATSIKTGLKATSCSSSPSEVDDLTCLVGLINHGIRH